MYPVALSVACVGVIDRMPQANLRKLLRSDTPNAVRLWALHTSVSSTEVNRVIPRKLYRPDSPPDTPTQLRMSYEDARRIRRSERLRLATNWQQHWPHQPNVSTMRIGAGRSVSPCNLRYSKAIPLSRRCGVERRKLGSNPSSPALCSQHIM